MIDNSGDEIINWPSCNDFGCIANKLIIVVYLFKLFELSPKNKQLKSILCYLTHFIYILYYIYILYFIIIKSILG